MAAHLPPRRPALADGAVAVAHSKPLIDCDVHPGVQTVRDLLPYMSEYWQEQFINRGIDGLDLATYPPNAPLSCRPDWREPGAKPGVRLEGLRAAVLDGFGAELAICNPLYGGQVAMSEQMGAAVCSAVNQWLAREWLDKEPRLRGSIVVHSGNAALAAEEIDRWAPDRRFVQVQLLVGNELMLGRNQYWPIYQAAQRHGLPVGVHAGTMYRYPSTSSGWPAHLLQDYASMTHMFAAQLQSLLMEGVFAKFPDLRFVMIESASPGCPAICGARSRPGAVRGAKFLG